MQPRYTRLRHVLLEDDGQLPQVALIAGLLHERIISTMLLLLEAAPFGDSLISHTMKNLSTI